MAGVVFFFEDNDIDVYSGRQIDLDAWHLASRLCKDIDTLIVINRTDVKLTSPNGDIDFRVVDELPELSNAIYLCPHAKKTIYEIDHNEVDWYVFGPAAGWGFESDEMVSIPAPRGNHLHSQHVMSAVMFDRYRNLEWQ